jgi:hypothetical protein|tara:strand:+ start:169 stop:360 length:192 start_codon:yes stop_codon:yes gene_type:complete
MTDKNRTDPPRFDVGEAGREMANAWMEIAKQATHIAHARRTIYDAYISEGFTPDQAIQLIKAP